MLTAFMVKKWLGSLLLPLPLLLILAGWGLWRLLNHHQRSGRALLILSLVSLCLLSTRPVANALIGPLEAKYPPFLPPQSSEHVAPTTVQAIVVLGAAQVADPALPLLSQLGQAGLIRITEGIALAHAYPEAQLIVSGYAGGEGRSSAELYSSVAQQLGIDAQRIVPFPLPKDTAEEAAVIAPLLHGRRSVLITSASHMPRAMALFNQQGATPIAAPVGHHAKESSAKLPLYSYLPSARYLERSAIAWHEYLGFAWQKLNNSAEFKK